MGRQRSCTKFLQEYGHEGAKDNNGNSVAKGKREEIVCTHRSHSRMGISFYPMHKHFQGINGL